jgi:hypothetical protein
MLYGQMVGLEWFWHIWLLQWSPAYALSAGETFCDGGWESFQFVENACFILPMWGKLWAEEGWIYTTLLLIAHSLVATDPPGVKWHQKEAVETGLFASKTWRHRGLSDESQWINHTKGHQVESAHFTEQCRRGLITSDNMTLEAGLLQSGLLAD